MIGRFELTVLRLQTNERFGDLDEKNRDDTGYFLCGEMLSYGCTAGYLGDGRRGSDYPDSSSLNTYDVSRFYGTGSDR